MNDLREAELIAKRNRLRIVAKRTGRGDVQNFKLYRQIPGGVTYLGSRVNAAALLDFVKRCVRVETNRPLDEGSRPGPPRQRGKGSDSRRSHP